MKNVFSYLFESSEIKAEFKNVCVANSNTMNERISKLIAEDIAKEPERARQKYEYLNNIKK